MKHKSINGKKVAVEATAPLARELITALQLLDGYDEVVDGKPIRKLYQLGMVRLLAAKNLNKLRSVVTVYDEALRGMIAAYTDGGISIDERHPRWREFQLEHEKLVTHSEEIELDKIKEGDLGIERNPIPVVALGILYDSGVLVGEEDVS